MEENVEKTLDEIPDGGEDNAPSKFLEMFGNLKNKISGSTGSVLDGVINNLAEVEIQKRIGTVTKAFEELKVLDKTIKDLKPDQDSFDAEGKLVSSTYSKAKSEELKKAKKRYKEIDQALTLALSEKPDFSKLNNLVK